jgi:glycosyltransferase involved in cell wall biosynthesis
MTLQRICFFAESQVGIGSVARTLKPLALESSQPRITWVDVTYGKEGGWLERLPLRNGLTGTARGFLETRDGLRQGPFDALLFLTHNPAVFHVGAMRRTPTVLWSDVTPAQLDEQAELYRHPRSEGALSDRLKRIAVQRTFRAARRCVAWSEWARRSLVADYGIPPERTAVVPPGLDLRVWSAPSRPARQRGSPIKLLFVGGDFERKGGRILLDVYRETLQGTCEIDIVTRDSVTPMPGVRVHAGLAPGSDRLLDLYRSADLFVLPTLADCYSIASIEAMAMGLPVLTTKMAGIPEVVDDGRTGWLVAPGDGRALSERLRGLVGDPGVLVAAGEAGLRRVLERFDARVTLQLLLQIAARPG